MAHPTTGHDGSRISSPPFAVSPAHKGLLRSIILVTTDEPEKQELNARGRALCRLLFSHLVPINQIQSATGVAPTEICAAILNHCIPPDNCKRDHDTVGKELLGIFPQIAGEGRRVVGEELAEVL
ncbi:hypothetical protein MSAN_00774100 [Mycena sanguinolenta]|uniref:Uncharacterized protein n=1 Tax=Mycena sanguinolenta TaxID=230812 RepID=A0A8H6Z7S5_9AGAR|nr:hypothetical protein MSAN_00774100 [Mycena sanguinolenta]